MRWRNWTFYKCVLYLGLAAAICFIGALGFVAIYRYDGYWKNKTVQLLAAGALLQVLFYLLCVRLVHYYVPNKTQPGKIFTLLFNVLLAIDSCLAISLLLLFVWGFSEAFMNNNRLRKEDYVPLFLIGSYTLVSLYIPATSVVLQRYNRYQVAASEEQWLNQLGKDA